MYVAIDLKSFYASVECVERGLDPLTTNLVVADESRTTKTICLAVSPSLKKIGIPGRPRLFEVVQKAKAANVSYLVAPPRMALYMEYSTRIYNIYLRYIAPEDIHVYSIDEVFLDVTHYLKTYGMKPRQLAMKMMQEVYEETGITATAGIGTNLYLCKVAMDIVAKHIEPDQNGVRIAQLDEISYRKLLWEHRPITDFWRVGAGYAKRLAEQGIGTMGQVARCSIGKSDEYYNEDLLYRMFGINAELLIDHAWGYEPCTIEDVKAYKPDNNSMGSGQVLHCPYEAAKARIVVQEMADQLVLDLVEKGLVTDQVVLTVGYDIENLSDADRRKQYRGAVVTDRYGRQIPKHAHGTENLTEYSSSTREIVETVLTLYDRIVNPNLLVRRLNVVANHVIAETAIPKSSGCEQLSLFIDYDERSQEQEKRQQELDREKKMQHAMLDIKKRFGKNAILKGTDLQEGATARDRNAQIGGHKA